MSVASLENGNLTLNSLTISNSQYAEASGYVAQQSFISSTKDSVFLTVPNSISSAGLVLYNGSNTVALSNSGATNLVVGGGLTTNTDITVSGGDITLGSGTNSVLLTGTTANLNVAGGISAFGATIQGQIVSTGGQITLGSGTNSVLLTGTTANLSINGGITAFGATINGPITLSANGGTGTLSVNSSNQLLWNGVVIS
jgi:hypothetical protein